MFGWKDDGDVSSWGASVDLSTLDGSNGFALVGSTAGGHFGWVRIAQLEALLFSGLGREGAVLGVLQTLTIDWYRAIYPTFHPKGIKPNPWDLAHVQRTPSRWAYFTSYTYFCFLLFGASCRKIKAGVSLSYFGIKNLRCLRAISWNLEAVLPTPSRQKGRRRNAQREILKETKENARGALFEVVVGITNAALPLVA